MKKCNKCESKKIINEFEIVNFNDETEEFIFGDVCLSCKAKNNSKNSYNLDGLCDEEEESSFEDFEKMSMMIAIMCQADIKIISKMTYETFINKSKLEIDKKQFNELKSRAVEIVSSSKGMEYVKDIQYGKGTYIVVGDSHGAYEKDEVVSVVSVAAKHLGAKIIHVGHAMDNFGNISSIAKKNGVVIVALPEETRELANLNVSKYGITIARGNVVVGDVIIRNQSVRDDYAIGSTKSIMNLENYFSSVIVGRHSHEMHTLTKNSYSRRIMSPGCLCERHMRKKPSSSLPKNPTIKDVQNVSLDYNRMGRRQKEVSELWEYGMIIVNVSSDGKSSIYPLRIKDTEKGFCTVYGRKVFTENSVEECDDLGLVIGDAHVAKHDPAAIDVVDRVASLISPDYFVNLGDHVDCSSLNHHRMDRGEPIIDSDIVNEFGKASSILSSMSKWSDEKYYVIGNHSRFLQDFYGKFPSLTKYLDVDAMLGATKNGYKVTKLKGVLNVRGAKFIHGDMKIYGATSGERHDKISSTMECDTMVGHCHNPSVRRGVYFVGLLGALDQGYNEKEASNWMHGFGLVAHYGGEVFMTTVGFEDYRLLFMGREINGDGKCAKWNPPDFDVNISYVKK